ncbi:MAG TPA: AAA family ATPase [Candidatus Acidoferrum sp.]
MITGTFFFHQNSRHKKDFAHTPDELVELIETHHKPRKADLQWIKLAKFGNHATGKSALRNNANVLSVTGIEADYDAGVIAFDDAVELLEQANIEAIAYTSPSHKEDKPRWRILAPLSKEYPGEKREKFLARLNGIFKGALGAESFTLSQSYYFGYVGNDAPVSHRAKYVAGDLIDLRDDLDRNAIGKNRHQPESNGEYTGERLDFDAAVAEITSGGDFHVPMRRIIASMIARGVEELVVRDMALGLYHAAVRQRPDLHGREREIPAIIEWVREQETKKQQQPQPAKTAPAEKSTPPPQAAIPEPADIREWDFISPPMPQWAVPELIPLREVTLLSGEGAAGKSTIALHLAAATALGLGWIAGVPDKGPAFFIDAEDDINIIHWRLEAVRKLYGTTFTELHDNGLRIWSLAGKDALFTAVDKNRGMTTPTPLYKFFLDQARSMQPKIIVIASCANVFSGNENDRPQVTFFVNMLKALAIAAEGSVVLISHPSLQGINSGTGLSGSTQWHNAVRARMVLSGCDDDKNLRELEFQKNQYGPTREKVVLEYNTDARMFLVKPGMSHLEIAAKEAKAETVFLYLLRARETSGRHLSDKPQSRHYAPKAFATDVTAFEAKLKKEDLEAAMERLFVKGTIKVEPYGPPSDKTTHIVLV